MYQVFFIALLFCQGLSALVSFLQRKQFRNSELQYFSFYLGFIFLSELLFHIFGDYISISLNQTYYNFFVIPIEFLFFYALYYKHSSSFYRRYLHGSTFLIYLLVFILEKVLFSDKSFLSISYMFGSILLLIVIFDYLYRFVQSGDIENIRSTPLIYISMGLLFFYIGSFPYYGLKNYLWKDYKIIGNNYWYVVTVLNCFMYCMFTVSFVCKHSKFTLR